MTPTEQDNELREAIGNVILGYGHAKIKSFEAACNEAMQLFTADRKRVELEVRIHEIGLMQHQARINLKTSNAVADWGDIRIAELKAQQEEV